MATRITQATLRKLLLAKKRIADLEASVKVTEEQILAALKDGSTVQNGVLIAEVRQTERRNVAWRQAFEEQISKRDGDGKGKELADRILAATHPQTYESLSVKAAA
jgi:hypothetical protein